MISGIDSPASRRMVWTTRTLEFTTGVALAVFVISVMWP